MAFSLFSFHFSLSFLIMDDTDGGVFELPKLTQVSDRARQEFESFFNHIPGSKEFVIQSKSLMALLEHVTPMRVLRRYKDLYKQIQTPLVVM